MSHDKARTPKGNPEQRYRSLSEVFIGKLTTLYRANPARAADLLERMLFLSNIIQGDEEVRKTYTIDLKQDFDDPKKHAILLKLVRKKARELLTAATLLMDNREPQIGVSTDDFFEGGTKEALQELGEGFENPGDDVVEEA